MPRVATWLSPASPYQISEKIFQNTLSSFVTLAQRPFLLILLSYHRYGNYEQTSDYTKITIQNAAGFAKKLP